MLARMDAAEFTCQTLPSMRPQLRIAVVTETYPPEVNGVAMTLGRVVDGLQVRNHQIQLIRPRQRADDVPRPTATLTEHLQRGIPLPRYEGLKMGLPAKAALTRLWARQRPDVVQIATEGPLGWSALAAANKLRLPVASDFHTNFHSYSSHYGFGLLRRAIVAYLKKFHNKAAVTLVPTEGIRRELLGYGYENIEIIGRGVDTRLFHPGRRDEALRRQWGVAADDPVALYVGRLAPEKNLPWCSRPMTRCAPPTPQPAWLWWVTARNARAGRRGGRTRSSPAPVPARRSPRTMPAVMYSFSPASPKPGATSSSRRWLRVWLSWPTIAPPPRKPSATTKTV